MSALTRTGDFVDQRVGVRGPLRAALRYLFPTHWSFLLGEVTLFSFVGLVLSGVYLALFYRASEAPVVWHGSYAPFDGRPLPAAFASVLHLSLGVPFGLVVRRFHHFAAHLFIGSLIVHAARVFFTGAFRRPREITWWIGLALFALALVNGFTGYCLPFDMRGGSAIRMMMTTLTSVPWVGGWLATLVVGAPFPGPFVLARLFIEHVLFGPVLIAVLVAAHLALVVRLSHTDFPGPNRTNELEVGEPTWPEQTARSAATMFFVWGVIALLSAFFPVEAVFAYGPFQTLSSYPPLEPDWYLFWIEGAWRMLPRQLNFHLIGATFTNPFYGAVVLPLLVFGGCVAWPFIDARLYGTSEHPQNQLDHPLDRPLRTAFGVSGILFLVMLSLAVLDDAMASVFSTEVWRADLAWGVLTLGVPPAVFLAVFLLLRVKKRARRSRMLERASPGELGLRGS